jgi:hypothetical protein
MPRRASGHHAARNGFDLDGTPLIKTVGEVESLRDKGCAHRGAADERRAGRVPVVFPPCH